MKKALFTAIAIIVTAASQASITIATFADPAPNGGTPLFTWDQGAGTLGGTWTGSGLTLLTPGFTGGGSTADTHFVMSNVTLSPIVNNVLYSMSAGTVKFYTTDVNTPFFTITFDGGLFQNPFNVGASTLIGNTVDFAGTNVPTTTNEQFSFGFANAQQVGNTVTYTSSFTSSADVVPEPVSMIVLASGLAAVAARRRKV